MFEQLLRPNVRRMQAYASARNEFQGRAEVYLDANENPLGTLNRYPDPYQKKLRRRLAALNGVGEEQVFVGSGSDEVIDLLQRLFGVPGQDAIVTCPPTYGMYRVSAALNDLRVCEVPLRADFTLDLPALNQVFSESSNKLLFLCSPNNPTGNLLPLEQVRSVLNAFPGIVCVDEAYIEYADAPSAIELLGEFPNLVVSRTLSKYHGLAAARVGYAFAHPELIALLDKIKPPYNLGEPSAREALAALSKDRLTERARQKTALLQQRARMQRALVPLPFVRRVFPSDANFLLMEVEDPDRLYRFLAERGIVIRNRNSVVPGGLRISVGTAMENDRLLEAVADF